MATATNEMTMNAQGHWPALLRMAAAWSQTRDTHTAHAMVDLLRSNALTTTLGAGQPAGWQLPAGEGGAPTPVRHP